MAVLCPLVLFALNVQPLASPDFLEPSLANEVEHARLRAPTNAPATRELPFATNGLTRTDLAVKLVSRQRSDGRWFAGTNDVTYTALGLLNELVDEP